MVASQQLIILSHCVLSIVGSGASTIQRNTYFLQQPLVFSRIVWRWRALRGATAGAGDGESHGNKRVAESVGPTIDAATIDGDLERQHSSCEAIDRTLRGAANS